MEEPQPRNPQTRPPKPLDDSRLDETHMTRAIELARAFHGRTAPNPLVGSVIVRNGEIVAEGAHRGLGGRHAEREALAQAGSQARGATVYVTLEPCSHFGRTGPCAQALIDAGVARVVIGALDPNPLVAGAGLKLLQMAGIETEVGVCAEAARAILAPFAQKMQTGRPWFHGKWAMSADGKSASVSGDSRWISSQASRDWVHGMRGKVDLVLTASGTVLADDPLLNARPAGKRTPARALLDRRGRSSPDCRLARSIAEGPVLLITSPASDRSWRQAWRARGAEVLTVDDGVTAVSQLAASRGWTEIWVEGGGGLLGSLFARNWIDEVHVFIGPKIVGGVRAAGPVGDPGAFTMAQAKALQLVESERMGPDLRLRYRIGKEPGNLT